MKNKGWLGIENNSIIVYITWKNKTASQIKVDFY